MRYEALQRFAVVWYFCARFRGAFCVLFSVVYFVVDFHSTSIDIMMHLANIEAALCKFDSISIIPSMTLISINAYFPTKGG